MFDLLKKPKFYKRCKLAARTIKLRLETIKRKRNAVEKYLRKDIVDLLKNGLDYNAYGRVEGFLVEQNRTACYILIGEFIDCISKNVSVMQKQSECPEECKEAVPSLIYAAARFSDLPELRNLRTNFTEKYGNSLEPFINQEFVKRLRAEPPTKETKLQVMHELAQENSIEWDSKALEQKLFKPPPQQNEAREKSSNDDNDDGCKRYGNKNGTFGRSESEDEKNGLNNIQYSRPKRNESDLASPGRKDADKFKKLCSNEEEVSDLDLPRTSCTSVESAPEDSTENRKPFYYRFIPPPYLRSTQGTGKSSTDDKDKQLISKGEVSDLDLPRNSCTSAESVPEDSKENSKPFYYRFIPAPYARPSLGKEKNSTEEEPKTPSADTDHDEDKKLDNPAGESKPKPRSVRRRPSNPPPGRVNESNGAANISSSALGHKESRNSLAWEDSDDEENMIDGLLMHYSKKPPYESANQRKANLPPPPGRRPRASGGGLRFISSPKSNPASPSARAATSPEKETSPTETTGKHVRASSLDPDMFGGHVHPKLPDYDAVAAWLGARRER